MSDIKLVGYTFPITHVLIDEFSSGDEEYRNTPPHKIKKIRITDTNQWLPDVISTKDFIGGSLLYVVWAEWTFGDSNVLVYNGGAEAFGIFDEIHVANELAQWLQSRTISSYRRPVMTYQEAKDNGLVDDKSQLTTTDGQFFDIPYIPWIGYFDALEQVHVDLVFLENEFNSVSISYLF